MDRQDAFRAGTFSGIARGHGRCAAIAAAVLCIAACSEDGPSAPGSDQTNATAPTMNNTAGPPPVGDGTGSIPPGAGQAGMAGVSTAGTGEPGGDGQTGAPGASGQGGAPQAGAAGADGPSGGQPDAAGAGEASDGPQAGAGAGDSTGDGTDATTMPDGAAAMDPPGDGSGTDAEPADGSGAIDPSACTRELLRTTIDTYFAALAAQDPDMLPLADNVKFTENGEVLELGEGLWATAGMVKFQESLLDTALCGTVTESVVPDGSTDIPLAVRLRLEAQQITEIQTIAVREGDYFVANNTARMTGLTPWGEIIPESQRATREQLESWMDKYFRMFPMGVCDLARECERMENGFTLQCSAGGSCSSRDPSGDGVMQPQIILVDVEAGLVAGFTMFLGSYTDVHMVHYAGGEVHGVHTILGSARSSGWD